MPDLAIGAPSVGSQFLTYKVSYKHGFVVLFKLSKLNVFIDTYFFKTLK